MIPNSQNGGPAHQDDEPMDVDAEIRKEVRIDIRPEAEEDKKDEKSPSIEKSSTPMIMIYGIAGVIILVAGLLLLWHFGVFPFSSKKSTQRDVKIARKWKFQEYALVPETCWNSSSLLTKVAVPILALGSLVGLWYATSPEAEPEKPAGESIGLLTLFLSDLFGLGAAALVLDQLVGLFNGGSFLGSLWNRITSVCSSKTSEESKPDPDAKEQARLQEEKRKVEEDKRKSAEKEKLAAKLASESGIGPDVESRGIVSPPVTSQPVTATLKPPAKRTPSGPRRRTSKRKVPKINPADLTREQQKMRRDLNRLVQDTKLKDPRRWEAFKVPPRPRHTPEQYQKLRELDTGTCMDKSLDYLKSLETRYTPHEHRGRRESKKSRTSKRSPSRHSSRSSTSRSASRNSGRPNSSKASASGRLCDPSWAYGFEDLLDGIEDLKQKNKRAQRISF